MNRTRHQLSQRNAKRVRELVKYSVYISAASTQQHLSITQKLPLHAMHRFSKNTQSVKFLYCTQRKKKELSQRLFHHCKADYYKQ